MTGNAINAKSEALELRELSSEQLDAVSGGWFCVSGFLGYSNGQTGGGQAGQNDPAQMFSQIIQQMTSGG